ncbi:hypothetical protein F4680DRAFT_417736 [Xylaria scruposa]|nr:hypothetical protein F4680DRAFT_417736 [Xylaria scruposa]
MVIVGENTPRLTSHFRFKDPHSICSIIWDSYQFSEFIIKFIVVIQWHPMDPMEGIPSPSSEQELDDEVDAFLQGSGSQKVPGIEPESPRIGISNEQGPLESSNTHGSHLQVPTDQLSLCIQVDENVVPTVYSSQSKENESIYMTNTTGSSLSETGARERSLSLRNRERQTSSTLPTLSPQPQFDFDVFYEEETGEFTSRQRLDSPLRADYPFEDVSSVQGSNWGHNSPPSKTPNPDLASHREEPDEVLVVVMGSHGSGKTAFITSVIGSQPREDQEKENYSGLQSHFMVYLNNNYCLLETPGFENEFETEVVTRKVLLWLETYYSSGKSPENTTILYLHHIGEPRLCGSIRRSLDTFKSLLGPGIWPQVVLGTTGWTAAEKETPGLAEKRELEMLSSPKFWKDMQSSGAGVMRIPEQDIFAKEILERVRDRIISRKLQSLYTTKTAIIDDFKYKLERKTKFIEYERRVLEMLSQIHSWGHRSRLASPSSTFQLVCNECRENCGIGEVYQCQDCYRDTSQGYFILCSQCYHKGKSCDQPNHRKSMKRKVNTISCQSHAATRLQGWDFIPCSCCDGFCDIVFLHCCDCFQDGFNMCLRCMKRGARCESEKHTFHIVHWWRGQGGLASEAQQSLQSDDENRWSSSPMVRAKDDDEDFNSITGLGIRKALSRATADIIRAACDRN